MYRNNVSLLCQQCKQTREFDYVTQPRIISSDVLPDAEAKCYISVQIVNVNGLTHLWLSRDASPCLGPCPCGLVFEKSLFFHLFNFTNFTWSFLLYFVQRPKPVQLVLKTVSITWSVALAEVFVAEWLYSKTAIVSIRPIACNVWFGSVTCWSLV